MPPHHPNPDALTLRSFRPDEWAAYRAMRLRALADAPDAFGSTLAAEQRRLPADWQARLAAAAVSACDYPLLAELAGEPAGMAWSRLDAADTGLLDLYQMWVAPLARGRGVAQAVLSEVIRWAQSKQVHTIQLGVTCGDTAATRLYARAGFLPFGPAVLLRDDATLLAQPMKLALAKAGR